MLWYKSWLETRWRFLIGLGVLLVMACGTVFDYLAVQKLMPLARSIDVSGEIGRLIKDAVEIQRDFRGFVWLQWFRQNLTQGATLLAVLLGNGGILSRTSGGVLFTLSLPVTRHDLLKTRAVTGLAELAALSLVPSLLIPLMAPSIGQSYSVLDSLVHGVCIFIVGAIPPAWRFGCRGVRRPLAPAAHRLRHRRRPGGGGAGRRRPRSVWPLSRDERGVVLSHRLDSLAGIDADHGALGGALLRVQRQRRPAKFLSETFKRKVAVMKACSGPTLRLRLAAAVTFFARGSRPRPPRIRPPLGRRPRSPGAAVPSRWTSLERE
jgi:hypothetical protein